MAAGGASKNSRAEVGIKAWAAAAGQALLCSPPWAERATGRRAAQKGRPCHTAQKNTIFSSSGFEVLHFAMEEEQVSEVGFGSAFKKASKCAGTGEQDPGFL